MEEEEKEMVVVWQWSADALSVAVKENFKKEVRVERDAWGCGV